MHLKSTNLLLIVINKRWKQWKEIHLNANEVEKVRTIIVIIKIAFNVSPSQFLFIMILHDFACAAVYSLVVNIM